jgi:(1->4)-alpha-D-glucan 1-alpha-D-glucosylmutase
VQGTSGYDFLNVALNLLLHPGGMSDLTRIYAEFTGQSTDFPAIAHDKKLSVTQEALGSDVNRLASLFVNICECNRNQRDYTRAEIRRAIREVASCFKVYRTYVVPVREEITQEDRDIIGKATECAKSSRTDIDGGLFDFLRDVLTMQVTGKQESEFLLRFQQFTSPVMAKGVEDTAFYCYNRLTALNEVGADPSRDGLTIEDFHAYNAKMQATHPLTMTTLSTHDTKRSDDVRARMAVLSEVPDAWALVIEYWSKNMARYRSGDLVDLGTEYFYYQNLVAAWPINPDRMKAYMQKAMREAKEHTTWVANNKEYEDAVNNFIDSTFADEGFVSEVQSFVDGIKRTGWINSLSQTLLKCTAPGVPDLYQGSELWDLSLVDPDNRRPVDFDLRRKLLAEMHTLTVPQMMQRVDEGLPKLWTIHRALTLRRAHPDWFGETAGYTPLIATGEKANHAIAFLRGSNVITIVQRWPLTLADDWADTEIKLPPGRWKNHLTHEPLHGDDIHLSDLFHELPVALLVKEEK